MTISRRARMLAVRLLLPLVASGGLGSLLALPVAASTTTSLVVPTLGEAWYQAAVLGSPDDPACGVGGACAPPLGAPATPFAPDTLQVATQGGFDSAHAFISLDLSAVPADAAVIGGRLVVPVLSDPSAGTVAADLAGVIACAVTDPIDDARGGQPADAPAHSCASATAGVLDATGDPVTLTFDLRPLLASLTHGGIAILPSTSARTERAAWRLAIPARGHASDATITASVVYADPATLGPPPAADADDSLVATTAPPGQPNATSVPPQPPSFAAPVAPDVGEPAPQVAAGALGPMITAAAPTATLAAAGGYAYAAIWLLPVVLLALATMLARALTAPVVLPELPRE